MTTNDVLAIFADVFKTTPEAIRRASGPGARHFQRVRWAVLDVVADRYAARACTASNDQGNGYAARELNLDKSTVYDARRSLKDLCTRDPVFRNKVELATSRCIG